MCTYVTFYLTFFLFIECMISPVLAQNALTELEVVYYLASVVEGIEVRVPISRFHVYFFTCLVIFDRRV